MPTEIAVIAPKGFTAGLDLGGATLLEYDDWDAARAALLGQYGAAVLVSDGIPADRFPVMAAAVRQAGYPVIEVRSARWEGSEHSTLSAACRGVIAGFGPAGVVAALKAL
ncbi:MAG: hypothetical protein WEC33_01480 [Dehalococcoidia bacterium]